MKQEKPGDPLTKRCSWFRNEGVEIFCRRGMKGLEEETCDTFCLGRALFEESDITTAIQAV